MLSKPSEGEAIVSARRSQGFRFALSRPRAINSVVGQVAVAAGAIAVMLACLYAEVATPIAVTFGAVILLVLVTTTWLLSWIPATVVVTVAMTLALVSASLGGMDSVTARIEVAADFAVFVAVTVGVRATLGSAQREAMRAAELQQAADRLDTANAVLRTFTADAAHELRAPLTVLRAALEAAASDPDTHEVKVRAALAETAKMTQLIDRLLLLARSNSGQLIADTRPFDLADLLEEAAGRWAGVASERGSTLVPDIPDTATAIGDPRLLGQMLDNLLDNALAYSPNGAVIGVSARELGGRWRVTVSDDGPGIPLADRERVLARFARLRARERSDGRHGTGLGLAICQTIAEQHGALLRLEQSGRQGTAATFELPVVHS